MQLRISVIQFWASIAPMISMIKWQCHSCYCYHYCYYNYFLSSLSLSFSWCAVLMNTPGLRDSCVMQVLSDFYWTAAGLFDVKQRNATVLVGLDLFNDDTCPSGHISRPTQVNVSKELLSFSRKPSYTGKCVSGLLSFSKQLLRSDHIVHVWGLFEVNKSHHIR